MEDDVDIYADLPSLNLKSENEAQDCNCKELKREHSSLLSKLENLQRIKTNLENNLSSLLKTAKAEIARKDRMIDDLRKRLDDVTFRRSNRSESLGFSTHRSSHKHIVTRKYEDASPMYSEESETESHQIESRQDEYKNRKPQNNVNRIFTVFGERLHRKIMENEEEEKKQKALLKLGAETKTENIPKNSIENDKEDESQFSMNNNGNESNIKRCSSSEPSYRKNLAKRTNEEDDIRRHKRLKIEGNDKTVTEETDYNYLTRCDLTDNLAQYEMKDGLVKSEDRLDAAHAFRKEETIPYRTERKAASEYQDTKQDQSCTNGYRSEAKNNLAKDHTNSSNIKNSLAYSLRNSRSASTSNHVSERLNSGYRKNGHRCSPPKRSYSKSRSDYESLSSHRLRERSSRTYREKKYDDYKYNSRYKNDRLKRNDSEENDRKTRYRRRERDDLRDKSRYSSSDAEDRESSRSYKKKYENRRIKKETSKVSSDKKSYESNKTAKINFRESSSRTIVNSTVNCSAEKNIEKHKMKNESEIKSINSTEGQESTPVRKEHPERKESISDEKKNLEEGEILDTPEKEMNSSKISEDSKIEENNVKIIPVENKNENVFVNASTNDKVPLENEVNQSTKQLEVADISTKEIEVASCLSQENSKDCGEIIQLNSSKIDVAANEVHNCTEDEDTCKSHIDENLTDSTTRNVGTSEQACDNDIDDNDKNDGDERSKDSITETAIKIKETTDSNIESVSKVQELDNFNIESATKKEETDNSRIEGAVEVIEVNNFNCDNSIHKIDNDELRTSTSKVVTKMETVLNYDIQERDENRAPIESDTFHQISNKSSVETLCLNDHNYVQNPLINASDLDAIQNPSTMCEGGEDVPETAASKETKPEKTISVQSVGIKRTMSSVVKNKKQNKGVLISHRRKAVILSDSNASMTVLMNTNIAKTPIINSCNDNDSNLKPRACKISRVSAKATCK